MASARHDAPTPTPPRSGWYIYPHEPGEKQRYWDGREWRGKLRKRGFVANAGRFPRSDDPEARPPESVSQPPEPGVQSIDEPQPETTREPQEGAASMRPPVSNAPVPAAATPKQEAAPSSPIETSSEPVGVQGARPAKDVHETAPVRRDEEEASLGGTEGGAMEDLGYWYQRATFLSHLHAEALNGVMVAEERCRLVGLTDRDVQRRLEGLARPSEPFHSPSPPKSPPVQQRNVQPGPRREDEHEKAAAQEAAATNSYHSGNAEPDRVDPASESPIGRHRPDVPQHTPSETKDSPRSQLSVPQPRPSAPRTVVAGTLSPPTRSGSGRRAHLFEAVELLRISARGARKRRAGSRR